jgi:E-phenylitaconyl-CoA hydratase
MSVVTYELQDHVGVITLNRPDVMNAFNPQMYREFNEVATRFREDEDAWVAVITAAGDKAFSAGVDVKALDGVFDGAGDGAVERIAAVFNIELEEEYFCDKPIIAAIRGYCIGEGLSLALGCDLRIAGESAMFALPEGKIGVPTINAAIHGARIMGPSNALELLLLAEQRDAQWAYRTGLVNLVVPDEKVLSTAMDWAGKIAALSPLANRITKEATVRSRYRSFDEAVAIGVQKRMAMVDGHDAKEGRRAFIEKRKPRFIGS